MFVAARLVRSGAACGTPSCCWRSPCSRRRHPPEQHHRPRCACGQRAKVSLDAPPRLDTSSSRTTTSWLCRRARRCWRSGACGFLLARISLTGRIDGVGSIERTGGAQRGHVGRRGEFVAGRGDGRPEDRRGEHCAEEYDCEQGVKRGAASFGAGHGVSGSACRMAVAVRLAGEKTPSNGGACAGTAVTTTLMSDASRVMTIVPVGTVRCPIAFA